MGVVLTGGFLNMSDGKVDPAFTPQADQHVARVMENWFYCGIWDKYATSGLPRA